MTIDGNTQPRNVDTDMSLDSVEYATLILYWADLNVNYLQSLGPMLIVASRYIQIEYCGVEANFFITKSTLVFVLDSLHSANTL